MKFQKFCIMKVSRVHKIYTRVDMGHINYIKTIIGRRRKSDLWGERNVGSIINSIIPLKKKLNSN